MSLTPQWFGWLAAELKEADVCPLVWNLEGGYGPKQCSVAARHVIEGMTVGGSATDYLARMGLHQTGASQLAPTYSYRDGVLAFTPAADVESFMMALPDIWIAASDHDVPWLRSAFLK
jgi:hypothetical protein